MMRLSPLGRHPWQTLARCESHGTDGGQPFGTDAPALTWQELFHRRCGAFAPGHPGPGSRGALTAADGAAQPFAVLVLTRPGTMHDRVDVEAIALRTIWMGA